MHPLCSVETKMKPSGTKLASCTIDDDIVAGVCCWSGLFPRGSKCIRHCGKIQL